MTDAARRRRLAVHVLPRAARALREGSPWLFRDAVTRTSFDAASGDVAIAFDEKDRFVAAGLWDQDGEIALRVLSNTPLTLDAALLRTRLRAAHAARAAVAAQNSGYRVVFGEADALPGLVVDRYADTAVLKLYSTCWVPWLKALLDALHAELAPRCVVLRLTRNVAARTHALAGHSDGETLFGAPPPDELDFVENGLRFAADVVRGQKTGFFLDQRENRARVAGLAAGRRVLNVCAYSGGFSVYAAHGGAKEVVSLDLSAPALAAAVANFALNAADPQVAACGHSTLCGDAFELLAEIARSDERFDLVVLDPPAFAKRRDEVEGALAAYARLVRLGLGVLARGGVLVACSCSTRIDERQFAAVVASAARAAQRTLRVLASTGHPADHPATRELRYLKAVFAVAD